MSNNKGRREGDAGRGGGLNGRGRGTGGRNSMKSAHRFQLKLVKEWKPDWSEQQVMEFCRRHGFNGDKIKEGLVNVFEDERPHHSTSSQDWQEVSRKRGKREKKKETKAEPSRSPPSSQRTTAGRPRGGRTGRPRSGRGRGAPRGRRAPRPTEHAAPATTVSATAGGVPPTVVVPVDKASAKVESTPVAVAAPRPHSSGRGRGRGRRMQQSKGIQGTRVSGGPSWADCVKQQQQPQEPPPQPQAKPEEAGKHAPAPKQTVAVERQMSNDGIAIVRLPVEAGTPTKTPEPQPKGPVRSGSGGPLRKEKSAEGPRSRAVWVRKKKTEEAAAAAAAVTAVDEEELGRNTVEAVLKEEVAEVAVEALHEEEESAKASVPVPTTTALPTTPPPPLLFSDEEAVVLPGMDQADLNVAIQFGRFGGMFVGRSPLQRAVQPEVPQKPTPELPPTRREELRTSETTEGESQTMEEPAAVPPYYQGMMQPLMVPGSAADMFSSMQFRQQMRGFEAYRDPYGQGGKPGPAQQQQQPPQHTGSTAASVSVGAATGREAASRDEGFEKAQAAQAAQQAAQAAQAVQTAPSRPQQQQQFGGANKKEFGTQQGYAGQPPYQMHMPYNFGMPYMPPYPLYQPGPGQYAAPPGFGSWGRGFPPMPPNAASFPHPHGSAPQSFEEAYSADASEYSKGTRSATALGQTASSLPQARGRPHEQAPNRASPSPPPQQQHVQRSVYADSSAHSGGWGAPALPNRAAAQSPPTAQVEASHEPHQASPTPPLGWPPHAQAVTTTAQQGYGAPSQQQAAPHHPQFAQGWPSYP